MLSFSDGPKAVGEETSEPSPSAQTGVSATVKLPRETTRRCPYHGL